MNIPFNHLYHYIESRLAKPAMFYLFEPAGSRKITDLRLLHAYAETEWPSLPNLICHDQETLRWFDYTDDCPEMQVHRQLVDTLFRNRDGIGQWMYLDNLNLNQAICGYTGISVYDRTVLLHSELNSGSLQIYADNGFEPAYWFSHAMIARDWYRFAQHDARLRPSHLVRPFLIYSRGFTGSRRYRLKFLEILIQTELVSHCQVSCLHHEDHSTIIDQSESGSKWRLQDPACLAAIPQCTVSSDASAGYDVCDINSTACQIVLETHFDSDCLHLTEKSLRPIATAQPFMLMAAPGALALLRSYGFETYQGLIDESYDCESDPVRRMHCVVAEMRRLASMGAAEWLRWRHKASQIAQLNQKHFFSEEFESRVWNECIHNLDRAIATVHHTRGQRWMHQRRLIRSNRPENWYRYLHRPRELDKCRTLRHRRQGL